MLNEPELQASMRQQLINPLRLAWGLVIFLIVIVIAWAFLSDEDQTTSKIASKNSITINTLINSEDENISKIITTYPITVVIDEVEERKGELNEKFIGKLKELESLVIPMLKGLMKNADKEYIYWPGRTPILEKQIEKVYSITRPE